jgi:hypothetical protein
MERYEVESQVYETAGLQWQSRESGGADLLGQ